MYLHNIVIYNDVFIFKRFDKKICTRSMYILYFFRLEYEQILNKKRAVF